MHDQRLKAGVPPASAFRRSGVEGCSREGDLAGVAQHGDPQVGDVSRACELLDPLLDDVDGSSADELDDLDWIPADRPLLPAGLRRGLEGLAVGTAALGLLTGPEVDGVEERAAPFLALLAVVLLAMLMR